MPRADSESPLALALASVTCPTRREPRGIITPESERTSCVVLAITWSPDLALRASTGLLRVAGIVVPAASDPAALVFTEAPFTDAELLLPPLAFALAFRCLRLACAFASADVFEFTLAFAWPACTLVSLLAEPLV